MSTRTQKQKILAHLKAGLSITPLDALEMFECFRLGARIFDLREDGHPIQSAFVETRSGKRVKEYWMVRNG